MKLETISFESKIIRVIEAEGMAGVNGHILYVNGHLMHVNDIINSYYLPVRRIRVMQEWYCRGDIL